MDPYDVYKYLNILQATTPAISIIKSISAIAIIKSKLLGKNKVIATNSFAIPLLYTFCVIQWSKTDNRAVRIVLTNTQLHLEGKTVLELKTLHYN